MQIVLWKGGGIILPSVASPLFLAVIDQMQWQTLVRLSIVDCNKRESGISLLAEMSANNENPTRSHDLS